jgi:DNA-binding response OmpR family regulator
MLTSDIAALAKGAETLLVVEPDVLVRHSICDYLRECGFTVLEAVNGEEALAVLKEGGQAVDLILCEAGTSGSGDGFNLAQWLRTNRPGLPIILVGSPARAVETAGDLCAAGPTLARPYDPQILLDRIKRLLAEARRALEGEPG